MAVTKKLKGSEETEQESSHLLAAERKKLKESEETEQDSQAAERKKFKESEETEQDSQIEETFSKDLPKDIVLLILSKFLPSCSLADYVRFPAVCTSWNDAFKDEQQNLELISLPHQLPLLLFQVKDDESIRNFYNPANGRTYDFPLRGKPHNHCSRGSGYGWVLTVDSSDELFSVHLYNPFRPMDNNEIQLPPLKSRAYWGCFYLKKAAFSVNPSSPSSDELVVMAITVDDDLLYCRCGDTDWNDFKSSSKSPDSLAFKGGFRDVIYYKGQFHAIFTSGLIVCLDLNPNYYPNPKVTLLDAPTIKGLHYEWCETYIVECWGNLLIVRRDLQELVVDGECDGITRGFEVYELVDKNWVEIKSLNGYSLFLGGNASFSLLASNFPGCKPNHIYFTDDYKGYTGTAELGDLDLGVFNLGDGSFEAVAPGVAIINYNNGSLYPIWVQLML